MEKFARVCDVTGEGMNEGWVVNDGWMYIKYEEHAIAHAKKNECDLKEAYDTGFMYWTEWDPEEEDECYTADGQLIE